MLLDSNFAQKSQNLQRYIFQIYSYCILAMNADESGEIL